MGKYLKLYKNDSDYHNYANSDNYIIPNVSYAEDTDIVYYNPTEAKETKLGVIMAHYNATETNNRVVSDISNIKSLKVNGENVVFDWDYCFSEIGEYDVEIELIDTTFIEMETFYGTCLTSINIPSSVTTIGSDAFGDCTSLPVEDNIRYADTYLAKAVDETLSTYTIKDGTKWIGTRAFQYCTNLASIVIPDSVTSVDFGAFDGCSSLTEITCNAITAPTIHPYTFTSVANNGVLKVPTGSDYSSWLSTDEHYLGYYNWTIQEI